MGYRIRNLKDLRLTPRTYFLDANVWLYFMQGECLAINKYIIDDYNKRYQERYHTFVTRLLECDEAKIALSPLVVSEVVNAFIRRFAMPANLRMLGYSDARIRKAHVKYDYRENPERNYNEMLAFLVGQFRSFFEANKLVPCELGFSKPEQAESIFINFNKMNRTDFNDYCYYELCAENGWPLITDDEDLCFPEIEIYSYNENLLKKQAATANSKFPLKR